MQRERERAGWRDVRELASVQPVRIIQAEAGADFRWRTVYHCDNVNNRGLFNCCYPDGEAWHISNMFITLHSWFISQ